jgi:hypothetical protein
MRPDRFAGIHRQQGSRACRSRYAGQHGRHTEAGHQVNHCYIVQEALSGGPAYGISACGQFATGVFDDQSGLQRWSAVREVILRTMHIPLVRSLRLDRADVRLGLARAILNHLT